MYRWYLLLLITHLSVYPAATPCVPDAQLTRLNFNISTAESYILGKKYESAIERLLNGEKILDENPKLVNTTTLKLYRLLGQAHLKTKNWEKADKCLNKYCDEMPDDPIGIDLLIRTLLANSKESYSAVRTASLRLNLALERNPDDPILNYRMAKIHLLLAQQRLQITVEHSRAELKQKANRLSMHIRRKPQ
jgi:predicted Zn-dependent protease